MIVLSQGDHSTDTPALIWLHGHQQGGREQPRDHRSQHLTAAATPRLSGHLPLLQRTKEPSPLPITLHLVSEGGSNVSGDWTEMMEGGGGIV